MNHWNCPSGILSLAKSSHSICDLKHLPPANTNVPSTLDATSLSSPSNFFYREIISVDGLSFVTDDPPAIVSPPISSFLIRSSSI